MVKLSIVIIAELGDEIDFVDFVETLGDLWLFEVFEEGVDGDRTGLA